MVRLGKQPQSPVTLKLLEKFNLLCVVNCKNLSSQINSFGVHTCKFNTRQKIKLMQICSVLKSYMVYYFMCYLFYYYLKQTSASPFSLAGEQ